MEIANIILEFTKALAWPIVFLVGLLMFQSELRALAKSLKKVKLPGGAELDWQEKVRAVELAADRVEKLPKSRPMPETRKEASEFIRQISRFGLLSSPSNYDFGYYRTIAESDPNLALAGLRMELERMLQNIASVFRVDVDSGKMGASQLLRLLNKEGVLEVEEYELLHSVMSLANAALHGQNVSLHDALRTIQSSEAFLETYIPYMTGAMDRHDSERTDLSVQPRATQ